MSAESTQNSNPASGNNSKATQAEGQAQLSALIADITKELIPTLTRELLSQMQTQQPVQPAATLTTTAPQVTPQAARQPAASNFVGPLTENIPAAAGVSSSSLLSLFPEVEAAIITLIIQHEFRGSDIYKLDSRSNDTTLKEYYKSLDSILVPLSLYFNILLVYANTINKSHILGHYFFKYTAHLVKIHSEYEWSAVVGYHMAFFARRRREMTEGDYSGWGKADLDLSGEYLYPNRKAG